MSRRLAELGVAVVLAGAVAIAFGLRPGGGDDRPSPAPSDASPVTTAAPSTVTSGRPATVEGPDPASRRVLTELAVFTRWCAREGVLCAIGEVGWPDDRNGDAAAWNAVGELWYQAADAASLSVTAWAAGEWWGDQYDLAVYDAPAGVVSRPSTQAAVVEAHPSAGGYRRGVASAGGEFSTPGPTEDFTAFSNANPGRYDFEYHYDGAESFRFLASRGIDLVRIPFRWERIQRSLGGDLDGDEVARLKGAVDRAHAAGLSVVLDLHNYGSYWEAEGGQGRRRPLGSAQLPPERFADLWRRLSARFGSHPGVHAYGLMNEPVDLPGGAPTWEQASQAAVDAIRGTGDGKEIWVAGYNWSSAPHWTSSHDRAWISDEGPFRYEGHQYFDRESSGNYRWRHAEELADAERRGH